MSEKQTLGHFTELHVTPTREFEERRRIYLLMEDFTYTSKKYGTITVPKGFRTDFASVPPPLQLLFPSDGRYLEATIIHDYLYENAIFTKQIADEILAEGMKVLGVKKWRQICINFGVKHFGKGKYK